MTNHRQCFQPIPLPIEKLNRRLKRMRELLQPWVSVASLFRDQHVRPLSSHAATETTQPTAFPTAGRSQLLRADPAFWAGASVGSLVRFDEGRVGRITSAVLSPTLPPLRRD